MELRRERYDHHPREDGRTFRRERAMRIRASAKNGLGFVINRTGLNTVMNSVLRKNRCGILIYHDPRPEMLDRHLSHLKQDYKIITLDELQARVTDHKSTKYDPSLVITIDDGHVGNYALIETFVKHNVRPTIYVCSAIVGTRRMFWWQHPAVRKLGIEGMKRFSSAERTKRFEAVGFRIDTEWPTQKALSLDQLQELARVASIQSHTRFHPILTQCTEEECASEIVQSKLEIEALVGMRCDHFSFPNGNYDKRSIKLLQEAGYRTARTCDLGWNSYGTDPFHLKAMPVADDASLNWLDAQIAQIPTFFEYAKRGSFDGRFPQF